MEELFRESEAAGEGTFAVTLARYDQETGVLVVDQQATSQNGHDRSGIHIMDSPPPRRILETFTARNGAIRRVVELADEWLLMVRSTAG